ncbi:MAG: histidine phosphatase family protein [Pseudomonadota bacterium]
MKRLILMRHAKSSWDSAVARDFDRPLNARGFKAGKRMGRYLKEDGLLWDVMLVSPSQRTKQTVERLETGFGEALDPLYDDRLYMASATQLLSLVRNLDDASDTALLLGHNPGVQGLAMTLLPHGDTEMEKARARIEAKYPTAAIAVLDCPTERWSAVAPASARLDRFIKPKDLKKKAAAPLELTRP